MRCRAILSFLLVFPLASCIIVADDPDDDDTGEAEGADETGTAPACGDPGTNSVDTTDGSCVCEASHVWCDPQNVEDIHCCIAACGDPGTNSEFAADGQCDCLPDFVWCTDDPDDFTCCAA